MRNRIRVLNGQTRSIVCKFRTAADTHNFPTTGNYFLDYIVHRTPIYLPPTKSGTRWARNTTERLTAPGRNEAWPRLRHAVGQENHARPSAMTLEPRSSSGDATLKTRSRCLHVASLPRRLHPRMKISLFSTLLPSSRGDSSKVNRVRSLRRCLAATSYAFVRATYNNRGISRNQKYRIKERQKKKEREREREKDRRVLEGLSAAQNAQFGAVPGRLARFNKHITKLYDYERSRKRPAPGTCTG